MRTPESRAPRIRDLFNERAAAQTPARTPAGAAQSESARLARRFAALAHVLADPLPYARRLARVLSCERRRFPEIVARYVHALSHAPCCDLEDPRLIVDAFAIAFDAAPAFGDTS